MKIYSLLKCQGIRRNSKGNSYLEVAVTLPIFIALIAFVIDMTRLTWIRSSVRSAATLAMVKASSNPDLKVDTRRLSSAADPDYQLAKHARDEVIKEALFYKLSSLHKGGGIVFNKFTNVDRLSGGNTAVYSYNPEGDPYSLLRPGDSTVSTSPDGSFEVIHNSHVCTLPGNGEIEEASLGAGGEIVCPSPVKLTDSKTLEEMMFKYPTELVSEYTVETILFGKVKQKVVVGGYNYDIELARPITPTPSPSPSATPTPSQTPTITPTPTSTRTFTPTGSATPTYTATSTSTMTATPTSTATSSITPTAEATLTPTPTQTSTTTATRTSTPSPSPSPTATVVVTRSVCEDRMVYKANLKYYTQRYWPPGRSIMSGAYPSCVAELMRQRGISTTEEEALDRFDDRDEYLRSSLNTLFGVAPEENIVVVEGHNGRDTHRIATVYMDENCNRIPDPGYHCLEFTQSSIQSPISLLWEKGTSITDILSFTQFPLDPTKPGKWYDWRASDKAPLLIYDPKKTGKVDSAAMLFGNHTFGKQWENGYIALATLDIDGNSILEKDELDDISLWFDKDQDGISDAGEVKTLKESEVSAIFTTPSHTDPATGNVHALVGYKRMVGGVEMTLSSVDWFSKAYDSKMQAIGEKGINGTPTTKPGHSSIIYPNEPLKNTTQKVSGWWSWEVQGESPFEGQTPKGFLRFLSQGNSLSGASMVEVPLSQNEINARSAITTAFMQSGQIMNKNGVTNIQFMLKNPNGSETHSVGELSPDGNSINGRSTLWLEKSMLTYYWKASRINN